MRFLDLFSGIGGFRSGLEKAGHTCVGYVEWDKHARKSYQNMYNTLNEWTREDITKVEEDEIYALKERGVDIICGGFPCQAFSIAGRQRGFSDTRGTLFFEICRFAEIIKPMYLFLENVTGLLTHDGGRTFKTILLSLDELGYDVEWQVCNSEDFGIPQRRKRVFLIGHRREGSGQQVFPLRVPTGEAPSVLTRYSDDASTIAVKEATKLGYSLARLGDSVNLAFPESKTRRGRVGRGVAQTLLTSSQQGVVVPRHIPSLDDVNNTLRVSGKGSLSAKHNYEHIFDGAVIRKLTPKECFRLQGFSDELYEKAREVSSESQLYKQAGNSVTINVIYEIAKCLV